MQLLVLDGMPYPLAEAEHRVQSVWGIDRYTRRCKMIPMASVPQVCQDIKFL